MFYERYFEKKRYDMDFNNHKNVLSNRFGWCYVYVISRIYIWIWFLAITMCRRRNVQRRNTTQFFGDPFVRTGILWNVHRQRIDLVITLKLKEKQTYSFIKYHFISPMYMPILKPTETESFQQIIYCYSIELVLCSFLCVFFLFFIHVSNSNKREIFVCQIEKLTDKMMTPSRDDHFQWDTQLD